MKRNDDFNHHMVPSSKRKVNDSGDDEICTSADKVVSNDDLLIQILLRLLVLSLILFKSVSKRWLSLITDSNFTLLRSKKLNIEPPSGIVLQLATSLPEFPFVSLDSRIAVRKPPLITSFSFGVNSDNTEVLQSCNGLLLCCIKRDKYYVYNPTINLFKFLPLPENAFFRILLAFDPVESPHYKVICPIHDYNHPLLPVHIKIYSSETGNWSASGKTFGILSFMACRNVMYWHDAIHWIGYSNEVNHFNIGIENPHFILVDNFETLIGEASRDHDKLAVSCGSLLLIQMVLPLSSLRMIVFEMKNDYSEWFVKWHVNLDHIRSRNLNILPNKPYFITESIVLLGERKEPFLVLEVCGKLIQCNIISKTFHELCDLALVPPRRTTLSSFLFFPCLAGV